jgi:hypothetical protein
VTKEGVMRVQSFLAGIHDWFEIVGDERDGYFHSYVVILIAAGVLGLVLPIVLILGDVFFLDLGFHARDSLSSYYHSPMRDFWVGSLTVIGVSLFTYTWGCYHADFWASLIAGSCLLVVAFFPTYRPNVLPSDPHCGDAGAPVPPGCTDLEQKFGEATIAAVHIGFAIIALSLLGVIALIFGWSDLRNHKRRLAYFHFGCGGVIGLGLLIALAGHFNWIARIDGVAPLYIGEVLIVIAFGLGWLVRGIDLWRSGPPKVVIDGISRPIGEGQP